MAQTGVPSWSKTAATNATIDANINFAEGQAPSSLNDSCRAVMAALAKYRDDISGSLTTAGTSTAYTVSTNTVFDSLSAMSGSMLRLKFHTSNGATPTLNVDGLGAKSLVVTSGTAVPTGFITGGCLYDIYFDNSIPAWVCVNSQYQVLPPGTTLPFIQAAAPAGWTKSTSLDNAALRLVSGTGGGTGGSANFTDVLASRTISQGNLPNVTLTTTISDPGHAHSIPNVNAVPINTGSAGSFTQGSGGSAQSASTYFASGNVGSNTTGITASTSLGGSGTAMDFAVKYADAIICVKN